PNILLEALAAGVPTVATAVGGTAEIIDDRMSGLLVPPGDPSALAEAIEELLSSEDRRRAIAKRGQARGLQAFTFKAQAEQYSQLFNELVRDARQGAGSNETEPENHSFSVIS